MEDKEIGEKQMRRENILSQEKQALRKTPKIGGEVKTGMEDSFGNIVNDHSIRH